LAKGTFVGPDGTPAGKYVKRVWLEFGASQQQGNVQVRLTDKDGNPIPWDPVPWNPEVLTSQEPANWEIEADLPSVYVSGERFDPATGTWHTVSLVTLPRYLMVETVAGTLMRNPLVWWLGISAGSDVEDMLDQSFQCSETRRICVEQHWAETSVSGSVFFGDGDPDQGRDVSPAGNPYPTDAAHTSVRFIPQDPVAGHSVGDTEISSPCYFQSYCALEGGPCPYDYARIFQWQGPPPVWAKNTFLFGQGNRDSTIGTPGTCPQPQPSAPPDPPALPEVKFTRDYFDADVNLLNKLHMTPLDYKVTLK
jgi:hypothetical protein